jgi:7-keto-8-aminopelargonate synthetase and related enzymes
MNENLVRRIGKEVEEIKSAGLFKTERVITSPQGAEITVGGKTVLNFCANNYLGLSSHPKVIEAAHKAIDRRGYGMSSVRFICGTQDIHKELEEKLSTSWEQRIPYYMQQHLMPMAAYLNPCSMKKMPSFPMRLIMHRSSMAYGSARLSDSAMNIIIWKTWKLS